MPAAPGARREELEKQRDALRQEISTLKEAIIDIDTPFSYKRRNKEQLETLRTVKATRERELEDVEGQLAEGPVSW